MKRMAEGKAASASVQGTALPRGPMCILVKYLCSLCTVVIGMLRPKGEHMVKSRANGYGRIDKRVPLEHGTAKPCLASVGKFMLLG